MIEGRMAVYCGMRSWLVRAGLLMAALPAVAAPHVTFGTNWTAEAEHGGFYEAEAEGLYAKHGLDVTIRQGGPQVSTAQLLAAGALDFAILSSSTSIVNFVRAGAPEIAVAAIFQKDPQILMAHKSQGYHDLADLKGHPILISTDAWDTYWAFLKTKYQFTDDQIRPYTFNNGPFLADQKVIQQGYVTNDLPQLTRMGIDVQPFLLADYGYGSYACIIVTSAKMVNQHPDWVQGFVDASIEGWHDYLHGDPAKGNALIFQTNPDYTQDIADGARQALIDWGVVEGSDTAEHGIGTMNDARWASFFKSMVETGLYDASVDYRKGYTLRFVTPAK
jgi:NitT/TauT family transport system substrate-binding protein